MPLFYGCCWGYIRFEVRGCLWGLCLHFGAACKLEERSRCCLFYLDCNIVNREEKKKEILDKREGKKNYCCLGLYGNWIIRKFIFCWLIIYILSIGLTILTCLNDFDSSEKQSFLLESIIQTLNFKCRFSWVVYQFYLKLFLLFER